MSTGCTCPGNKGIAVLWVSLGFPHAFFLPLLSSPFHCAVFVVPKYFALDLIAFLVFPFILPSFPVPFSLSCFSLLSFCPISSFKPFFTLYSVLPSCNLGLSSPHPRLFFSVTFFLDIYPILSLVVFLVFLPCDPTDQWPEKQGNIQSIHYTFLSQVIQILFMNIICISKEMRHPKWSHRPWRL